MDKRYILIIINCTGISAGYINDFHKYAEKLLGRNLSIHKLASYKIMKEIKNKSKFDFIELNKIFK